MKRIPIAAARRIAEDYGYDQVVIYDGKLWVCGLVRETLAEVSAGRCFGLFIGTPA